MEAKLEKVCEGNLIAAYVDGELDLARQTIFEHHLENCQNCRQDLRIHQQFVCELDAVLAHDDEVVVPLDFSRVIAARAVSDMSGVRSRSENRKALVFCLVLGVTGFALIGSTTRFLMISLVGQVGAKIVTVAELFWHAVYDLGAGIVVIFRVLSRRFIVDTGNRGLLLVLLAFGVFLLSRLISNYHRADAIE